MKIVRPLTLLLALMGGVSVWAVDLSAPPMIAETWTCSFKDGKNVGDLLKARDFMVSQANKKGLTLAPAFLWNLRKGEIAADYVWFNVHQDVAAFGTSTDAFGESGVEEAVMKRFSSVSDCVAGLGTARMIFQRGEVPRGSIFIEAMSCKYFNGTNQESLDGLISEMNSDMKRLGANAPAFSTALMPFTLQSPGSPDVILYSGFENAKGWSNYIGEKFTHQSGQGMRDRIRSVLDCSGLTLWSSQQVIGAAAQASENR